MTNGSRVAMLGTCALLLGGCGFLPNEKCASDAKVFSRQELIFKAIELYVPNEYAADLVNVGDNGDERLSPDCCTIKDVENGIWKKALLPKENQSRYYIEIEYMVRDRVRGEMRDFNRREMLWMDNCGRVIRSSGDSSLIGKVDADG